MLFGVMLCCYHSVVNRRNSEKRKKVTGVLLLWALACTVSIHTPLNACYLCNSALTKFLCLYLLARCLQAVMLGTSLVLYVVIAA